MVYNGDRTNNITSIILKYYKQYLERWRANVVHHIQN